MAIKTKPLPLRRPQEHTISQRRILEKIDRELGPLAYYYGQRDLALRLRFERRYSPSSGNGRVVETQIRRNEKRIAEVKARVAGLQQELEGGASDARS